MVIEQRGKEDGEQTLCSVYKFRRMICYAMRFWIVQFPVHFDMDPKLSTIVKDWQKWLVEQDYSELAPLVDISCLPSYDWIRNISVRDPSVKHCRKVSLVFNHLEPSELAKHLTYLEHRIMRRISVTFLPFCFFTGHVLSISLDDTIACGKDDICGIGSAFKGQQTGRWRTQASLIDRLLHWLPSFS